MSSLFSSDMHKFKLETQLKTLTHIVNEKQVKIKDAITIISLLNASRNMLVAEVLKFVKLILAVLATNAVSERSCSTLHRFKTYLQSSLTQELLTSCLILATYKEKVDKLKLVEVANQFLFQEWTLLFHLTLICVGFLGVRFEVRRIKLSPVSNSLELC